MLEEHKQTLDISWQSLWRLAVIILLFIAIWFFREILLLILGAFIIASLLEEPINYLTLKIKNRWLATLTLYLVCLFIIGFLGYLSMPYLFEAFIKFIVKFNLNIDSESIKNFLINGSDLGLKAKNIIPSLNSINSPLFDFVNKSIGFITKMIGGIFSVSIIFLLAFFFNTERYGLENSLRLITPKSYGDYPIYLWERARKKVAGWFYSQLILSVFVSFLVFVIFKIIAFPEAEFLALLAGVLDFIPYIGPTIVGGLILIFGFEQSITFSLFGLGIFIGIQLLENIIAPSIRAKVLQMNPLIIIFAILFGGKLAGALGILVALPLTATLMEFLRDLRRGKINNYFPQKKLL
ncbi:MAG: AI-2E family transporter [Minisyncoccia bacterium]